MKAIQSKGVLNLPSHQLMSFVEDLILQTPCTYFRVVDLCPSSPTFQFNIRANDTQINIKIFQCSPGVFPKLYHDME